MGQRLVIDSSTLLLVHERHQQQPALHTSGTSSTSGRSTGGGGRQTGTRRHTLPSMLGTSTEMSRLTSRATMSMDSEKPAWEAGRAGGEEMMHGWRQLAPAARATAARRPRRALAAAKAAGSRGRRAHRCRRRGLAATAAW